MNRKIKEKVVVVTGGASGIGFEIAHHFLTKGAKIATLLDINEKAGHEAVQILKSKHGGKTVKFIKCDVRSDVEAVSKKIIEESKTVDILVNSAGIMDESSAKKTFEVNTLGLIESTIKFWEHMRIDKGGKGGTIINISSRLGFMITPYRPIYTASKFAVSGFSKSLGHETNYLKYGVRVIAICPAKTESNLHNGDGWKGFIIESEEFLKATSVMGSVVVQKADDVGKAAVEVFERADSGTAWLVEAGGPPQLVA